MGSAYETAFIAYAPGKLQEAYNAAAEAAFYEYGHRYDAGVVYCGGNKVTYLGQLPPRVTIRQFDDMAHRLDSMRLAESWSDSTPRGYWTEYKDGKAIKRRSHPVRKTLRANIEFMNMLEKYIKLGLGGDKWDEVVVGIRFNTQEEKIYKERWGYKGTRARIMFIASWVPE